MAAPITVTHRRPYYLDVLAGRRRGAWPTALRAAATILEPAYSAAVSLRNRLYDARVLSAHSLARPTISVGNITTGGVGKTPLVIWLCQSMSAAGRKPAVLLRGYNADAGFSDEAELIQQAAGIPVFPDANRIRAAKHALAEHPEIDLFILDDAMQHRRVQRDFEIVVISAIDPWGGGHILPRGLLREPVAGISRAHAIVLTHCSSGDSESTAAAIRRHTSAPLFRTDHITAGFPPEIPAFAACAIGQPDGFFQSLQCAGATVTGHLAFPDHHRFTPADIAEIRRRAAAAAAAQIIVTEKDSTKIRRLPEPPAPQIPIRAATLQLRFFDDDAARLLALAAERSRPA